MICPGMNSDITCKKNISRCEKDLWVVYAGITANGALYMYRGSKCYSKAILALINLKAGKSFHPMTKTTKLKKVENFGQVINLDFAVEFKQDEPLVSESICTGFQLPSPVGIVIRTHR